MVENKSHRNIYTLRGREREREREGEGEGGRGGESARV